MDFVARAERLPAPGETVSGSDFRMVPGGKGANQACAAAKLGPGCSVRLIGCTGNDSFAVHLRASLAEAGVDTTLVRHSETEATGIAMIAVDGAGRNSIVVAPGANHALRPHDVPAEALLGARVALFQLESPLDTVEAAMLTCRQAGVTTILDPAPARPIRGELLALASILTPNEHEAGSLLGRPLARIPAAEAGPIAEAVRALGPSPAVILKLGDQGCYYTDGQLRLHMPTVRVEAVDSTAAGDTCNGALAVALAEGRHIADALAFANACAALSVTRHGAQSSIPTRRQVDQWLPGALG